MIKMWWKIVKSLRTPLWIPLDRKYEEIGDERLRIIYQGMPAMRYQAEVRDCDNFALALVGTASQFTNAVGIIFGWHKGLHAWNCANMKSTIWQIEPQNGIYGKRLKGYHPILVIM